MGPPASGKSTQGRLLSSRAGFEYISWGGISRLLKKGNTALGSRLRECDRECQPHPAREISEHLINHFIMPAELAGKSWIIDGFPRSLAEFEAFEDLLRTQLLSLSHVVILSLNEETSLSRARGRRICPECDATFSEEDDLDVCPRDGADLQTRSDDSLIRERLEFYCEDTLPLICYLTTTQPRAAKTIEAESDTHTVFRSISDHLGIDKLGQNSWRGSWSDLVASAKLPTEYGMLQVLAFEHRLSKDTHLALVSGNPLGGYRIPVRIHSSCITGDIFQSKKCECGSQLDLALKYICEKDSGVLIYLFQEGRGIGIVNKLRAYRLQELGADTVEANRALLLPDDARTYEVAVDIIRFSGALSIELLTNNPSKVANLLTLGVNVVSAIPLKAEYGWECTNYMQTKREKMGHVF